MFKTMWYIKTIRVLSCWRTMVVRQVEDAATRHINIRYFFVTDNIKAGKMRVEYCPTDDMIGDFNTKPLQGSHFRKHLNDILNLSDSRPNDDGTTSQECVGATRSYADVVRGTRSGTRSLNLKNDADTSTKVSLEKNETAGNKKKLSLLSAN